MKIHALLLAATVALPALAQAPAARPIDVAKSEIRFVSKQMNVPVEGRFKRFSGTVTFDPKKPEASRAEVEIDVASIDTGTSDGDTEAQRPLWFNAPQFPRAKFVTKAIKPLGGNRYEASGTLTIKGVSADVASTLTLTEAAGTRTAQGELTLKRLVFKLGDKQWADTDTVADEVRVRYRFVFPQ
jgi:polyisoprenoid-binding protein YceI